MHRHRSRDPDPTQENDAMYHWAKEQLLPVVYVTFTLGIIFGCTLRPHNFFISHVLPL